MIFNCGCHVGRVMQFEDRASTISGDGACTIFEALEGFTRKVTVNYEGVCADPDAGGETFFSYEDSLQTPSIALQKLLKNTTQREPSLSCQSQSSMEGELIYFQFTKRRSKTLPTTKRKSGFSRGYDNESILDDQERLEAGITYMSFSNIYSDSIVYMLIVARARGSGEHEPYVFELVKIKYNHSEFGGRWPYSGLGVRDASTGHLLAAMFTDCGQYGNLFTYRGSTYLTDTYTIHLLMYKEGKIVRIPYVLYTGRFCNNPRICIDTLSPEPTMILYSTDKHVYRIGEMGGFYDEKYVPECRPPEILFKKSLEGEPYGFSSGSAVTDRTFEEKDDFLMRAVSYPWLFCDRSSRVWIFFSGGQLLILDSAFEIVYMGKSSVRGVDVWEKFLNGESLFQLTDPSAPAKNE